MTGVVAACSTPDAGRENALPASGHVWRMSQSNITGDIHRSSASGAFAMDRRIAKITRWESREQFRISSWEVFTMKAGSMISVRRDGARMNECRTEMCKCLNE